MKEAFFFQCCSGLGVTVVMACSLDKTNSAVMRGPYFSYNSAKFRRTANALPLTAKLRDGVMWCGDA